MTRELERTRRTLLRWLAAAPLLALAGCGPRAIEAPPSGPQVSSPMDVMPPDLELTLRISVERVQAALGKQLLQQVREQTQLGGPMSEALMADALERSRTAWVGLRPGLPPTQTDNVMVLQGDFSTVKPDLRHWLSPEDLGAGWQSWDRREKGGRALPSRIYALGGELLVFVSEAEIDAVARRLERGAEPARLEPPERGLVSIAASMPALAAALRNEAPRAAGLLAQGTVLTGFADFQQGSGLSIVLEFDFVDAAQAERSARAAELFALSLASQQGAAARIAQATEVTALGSLVQVRCELTPPVLSALLTCRAPEGDCS